MRRIYLSSPHMGGEELKYVNSAFKSNWIAPLGPNVIKFESSIIKYTGSKYSTALSSGTSAIHLALKCLGVKRGDLVFCSTLTFSATVNPVIYQGAEPVFIDSNYETWNMCPKSLEKAFDEMSKINRLPKAVIVVNLYGQSADYEKIIKICLEYKVPIIEDAAESLGSTYKGIQTGTIGDIGIYSFNGNKIITTSGGGMLVSNTKEYTDKALFWATQSRENCIHYEHKEVGFNYRMSNVLAGIGIGQVEVLDKRIKKKKAIYEMYRDSFKDIKEIEMMNICDYGEPNYWLSVITIDKNSRIKTNDIICELDKNNIEARPVWKPMHLQPIFRRYNFFSISSNKSVSEDLFERGLCLPSDTNMTYEEISKVIEIVKSYLKDKR